LIGRDKISIFFIFFETLNFEFIDILNFF